MYRDIAASEVFATMLEITLHNSRQHQQFQHETGPLWLARSADAGWMWRTAGQTALRTVEAVVEITPEVDGIRLHAGDDDRRLVLPAQFAIGDTRFEIADARHTRPRSLEVLVADKSKLSASATTANGPSPATLSRWFGVLGLLHRGATSPQEFYVQAARCAVEAIGLDGAIVLRRRDNNWEIVASHLPQPELGIHCNRRILDQLVSTPRTMFDGTGHNQQDESPELVELVGLLDHLEANDETAVVVSPLKNAAGDLIGAIYGFRSIRIGNLRRGIRYLEAHLVELVACAVSDGMARIEHAAEVDRRRVLAERAFVATNRNGRRRTESERREITLLFADLRDCSRLAHVLGVEQTYALLGDVMDALTAAVLDHDGMIIDYYGDGLAAMWNAPINQPDHPELACRAALRMIEALPSVQVKWADVLAETLRLGVGVHTGVAQLGNSGSSHQWKYGPRGANVHLAHRIEAATKAIGVPLVVSQATASRLSSRFANDRLCRVALPGIAEPVDLYGIRPATKGLSDQPDYQRALEAFEAGRLADAAETLAKLGASSQELPVDFLRSHVERLLREQKGRRSTDRDTNDSGSVIKLNVK